MGYKKGVITGVLRNTIFFLREKKENMQEERIQLNELEEIHPKLSSTMRMVPENKDFRKNVLLSKITEHANIQHTLQQCRPIPNEPLWFETFWKACQSGGIYSNLQSDI